MASLQNLSEPDRLTIREVISELNAAWPAESLVLYGSKARGDDTADSDIDLLLLTSRQLAPSEYSRLRVAVRQIGLRHGTWPELFIRTSQDWWQGVYQASPIRKEIDAEGIDLPLDRLGVGHDRG